LEQGHKLKAQSQLGYVVTNMKAVDQLNQDFRTVKMKRVFRHAGKHEAKHREFGLHLWYELEFNADIPVNQLLQSYKNLSEVEISEPIREAKLKGNNIKALPTPSATAATSSLSGAPNDPRFVDQWHYENTGQNGGTVGCDISLLEAWTLETGNSNVIVAIEDGGIDFDHEDLAGNMWINSGEIAGNGIDDDNNGYVDDVYGYNFAENKGEISVGDHGTHVAGTVAAETNNGIGVAGVAGGTGNNDGVRLMSCNVFATSTSGGFAEAYTYAADNGAVISQNSWGYTSKGAYEQAVLDAIDYFVSNAGGSGEAMNGGLVIFAAGNDDSSGEWYPGFYDSTLSVGATNCKDEKSWYSNYDTWVDISAPGGELVSSNTDPTAIHSTLPNNQYGVMQGTSMACPHVSGVAALIVSKFYGNITPQEVWNKLVNTTDNIDATIPSYIGKMGSGRMNAFAALDDGNPPATPTGLVASNVKATSFDLQWDETTGAASFDVQIREDGGTWSTFSASTNKYSYTSATAETTYQFQVRAVNSAGTSAYTPTGNVTTPALPPIPAIPSGITSSNITSDSFTLNWNEAANAYSYDIQVRPLGGSWTDYNTPNLTLDITGLDALTTYEYQVRATNVTGNSNYSAIESVTTEETPLIYCTSEGKNCTYEWISEVVVGTFTNSSGASGYSDFTSQVIDLTAGSTYAISLSPDYSGTSYSEYWKIWIDYNHDGIFNDAEELAFDAGSMSKTTVTGNITIPANLEVTTRMRVSMKYNGASTSCETFTYGEVEDYKVNITTGVVTPPATPVGLSASNITTNSFTLSWNSVSNATSYDLQIREQGGNWNTINTTGLNYDYTGASPQTTYEFQVRSNNSAGSSNYTTTQSLITNSLPIPAVPDGLTASNISTSTFTLNWNSVSNAESYDVQIRENGGNWSTYQSSSIEYNFTGLTPSTTYECNVRAVNTSGSSDYSSIHTVVTMNEIINYCGSQGSNSSYEWIDLVQLGSIDHSSGNDGGYADNTNLVTNLAQGSSQTIYFSAGFSSWSYTEYWHVWIDFNHDGTFSDTERVAYGSSSNAETISADFTVPTNALPGTTRMRVSMKYNAAATPCETFSYGEVEDFTVNITSTETAEIVQNFTSIESLGMEEPQELMHIRPNPAVSRVSVTTSHNINSHLSIMNLNGKLIRIVPINGNRTEFDVSNLPAGIYLITLEGERDGIVKKLIKK
jgi:subtilisin family serine protease